MNAAMLTPKSMVFGLVVAVNLSISPLAVAVPLIDQCQYNPSDLGNVATATATIDRLRNGGCLDKLRQSEQCLAKAAQLAGDVNSMLAKFNKHGPDTPLVVDAVAGGAVASSNVDLNIWRNFRALQNDYNASLEAIEHLVDRYAKPSPASLGIQAQISDLDRGIFAAADTITRLATREAALLAVIETSKTDLAALQTQAEATVAELVSPACQYAGTAALASKARLAVAAVVSDVDFVRQHVLQAKEARQGLLNYAYVALRSSLEQSYLELELQHTTELGSKIDVVLDLNRISSRFEAWFNYISFDQERDLVETVYQLYDESRRLWAADLVMEQAFKLQVSMVAESNPELAAPYLARINSVIQNTNDRLAQLERRGWSGYLTNQRTMATRLLTRPDKLPDNCARKLQVYLNATGSVGDIDHYRPLERQWRDTVQSCMMRGQT
jgi:hypothetical protein